MSLPSDVMATGTKVNESEVAWSLEFLPSAVAALVADAQAILGGEVLTVRGDKVWWTIPEPSGQEAVYSWDTIPRRLDEPWSEFVLRSAVETREWADRFALQMNRLHIVAAGTYFLYCLTWVREGEYESLGKQGAG